MVHAQRVAAFVCQAKQHQNCSSDAASTSGVHVLSNTYNSCTSRQACVQLVNRANAWSTQLGLSHCLHYLFGSASTSLGDVLRSYPGAVQGFAVQFPDPPHKKRPYILQQQLVEDIVQLLAPGGREAQQPNSSLIAICVFAGFLLTS